jgi:hypothetical protein
LREVWPIIIGSNTRNTVRRRTRVIGTCRYRCRLKPSIPTIASDACRCQVDKAPQKMRAHSNRTSTHGPKITTSLCPSFLAFGISNRDDPRSPEARKPSVLFGPRSAPRPGPGWCRWCRFVVFVVVTAVVSLLLKTGPALRRRPAPTAELLLRLRLVAGVTPSRYGR